MRFFRYIFAQLIAIFTGNAPVRPAITAVTSAASSEGANIVHSVTLASAVTGSPAVYSFSMTVGTASLGDFSQPPTFSNGVSLGAGIISVPVGISAFTVTVATVQDAIFEGNETYTITVDSLTGTGTINNDDVVPTVVGVTSASNSEGGSLVHTVTMSGISSQSLSLPFSLTNVTASTPSDYSVTPTFSNSVSLSGGNITIPAGVLSFTVTVATTQDTVFEGPESYTISVGGFNNTGTINDDEVAPSITSVSSGAVNEGTNIVHTVVVSGVSQSARTYAISLVNGTADGSDYTTSLSNGMFSNGVTVSGGNISVPAGVTLFTVTVVTNQDAIVEPTETYTLTIGGASGTGTINNDDAANPIVNSVTSATASEGANLVHTVTLSGSSASVQLYPFSVTNVTASTPADYSATYTFSAGVSVSGGNVSVPAGVSSFTVTVTTTQDTSFEGVETYTISVGGLSNTGTINDDDAAPSVTSVSSASATEGTSIVHTVTITGTAQAARTYATALTSVTADGTDYTTAISSGMFSNGVTFSAGNISVPAGVTSFTVTVATTGDTVFEANETYTLTIGGASGTGTINNNDTAPSIASVSSATANEGANLVHTVTITGVASTTQAYPFSVTNVTAATPSDYSATYALSNGVTASGGNVNVPAGVTNFTVTVTTTQDTVFEGAETYTISVGGLSNTGTINDDEVAPTITSVSSASATEGTSIVHTVTASVAAQSARNYAITLVSGTAAGTDYTTTLSNGMFSNGVTVSAGNVSLPAGVLSFTVTIPTTQDAVFEDNETYTLTVGGASGTGTINNDEATPTITSVTSVSVTEGTSAVHTVTLAGTAQAARTYAITLVSVTTNGADYTSALSNGMFSGGVTVSGGNVSVPAGVTSFTVTVSTNDDATVETNETYTLTIGGASGTGTILDNDGPPPTGDTFGVTLTALAGTQQGTAAATVTIVDADPLVPVINASRLTGVGPLAITFDALQTVAPALTTLPFSEIQYDWEFGDPAGNSTWVYGSNPGGNSKNLASGPVVAHVFETHGSYTVRCWASYRAADGTVHSGSATLEVVVTNPDVVFAANTIYISQNSTPTPGQNGVPMGATVQQVTSWNAIGDLATTYKRILLKRGDVWVGDGDISFNTAGKAGQGILGAYGTGAKPRVNMNVDSSAIRFDTAGTDWRVIDLDIVGDTVTYRPNGDGITAIADDILILRTDIRLGRILIGGGQRAGLYVVECLIGPTTELINGGTGLRQYGINHYSENGVNLAILGSHYRGSGNHGCRIQGAATAVVSNNYFEGSNASGHTFTLRGQVNPADNAVWSGLWTENVVVSDNYITDTRGSHTALRIHPQSNNYPERLRNILVERNHVSSASIAASFSVATGLTVRNNLFVTRAASGWDIRGETLNPGAPFPTQGFFYNNTIYKPDIGLGNGFQVAEFIGTISGQVMTNNLAYAPLDTTPIFTYGATPAQYTGSNNSSNTQIKNTRPWAYANPLNTVDFTPVESYANGGGVRVAAVYSDFFGTPIDDIRNIGAI